MAGGGSSPSSNRLSASSSAFELAALAVDGVELPGQFGGARVVVGQQAFDAQRHVGQAPRGVDAGPEREAEVEGGGRLGLASGRVEQGPYAGLHLAGAHALEALGHQAAVVVVQAHHVGHGAQRDQGQERLQPGLAGLVEAAARAQLGAQLHEHVEHHAHAGHGLALEAAARLVGVDDGLGLGQFGGGQVVVGHQHRQAQRACAAHALDAGDAVVHGHEQIGAARGHAFGNRGGEAVAVDHAVGHEVIHLARAQQAQAAQRHGAGGGAVAVVVGHDADARVAGDGVGQQPGGFIRALERGGRQQPRQRRIELVGRAHAARRIQARQQRVHARLLQRPGHARWHVAIHDFHSCSRRSEKRLR